MLNRRLLIAALILLAPALWAASLAAASTPSEATRAPQATIDAVYGQVFANGQPVSNVDVFLQLTAGSVATNVLTATTTITGAYEFANPPALQADERYNVVLGPQNDPAYLSALVGPTIDEYDTGRVFGGNLQVDDVTLIGPPNNATVAFPVTFQWQPRAGAVENYYVLFYDADADVTWPSDPVGPSGSLTLNALSDVPGLEAGKQYVWFIAVDSLDPNNHYAYSHGWSLARRNITFIGSGATATPTPLTTATPTATGTSPAASMTPTSTSTTVPATATATTTATVTATPTPTPTTTGTPWVPSHWVYLPYVIK